MSDLPTTRSRTSLFQTPEMRAACALALVSIAAAALVWCFEGKPVELATAASASAAAGFGLAASVLFVGALRLQAHELELQRRELEETREVHRAQQHALEKQARFLEAQTSLLEMQRASEESRAAYERVLRVVEVWWEQRIAEAGQVQPHAVRRVQRQAETAWSLLQDALKDLEAHVGASEAQRLRTRFESIDG